MTRDEAQRQTQCIARLAAQLSQQPRLQAELERARRQFFGDDLVGVDDDAAEHRFAEWFLIERDSETLGVVPVTVPPFVNDAHDLEGSMVGLFLVESVGATVMATDMQDGTALELAEVGSLEVGDLLVGRLYPVSGECWTPSAATPALRPGRDLAKAFVEDIKRLEIGRRLLQIELEHLLLREHGHTTTSHGGVADESPPEASPTVPLEHLEADLEQLLVSVGDRHTAEGLSQQLALAQRPGALIGPLLDQLAFDTDVDLDRARELLLEIWNAHHAGAGPSTETADRDSARLPGATLGEQLVEKLDIGMGQQDDVDTLFSEMERMAGLDPEDEDDDDPDGRQTAIVAEVFATGETDNDAGDLAPLVVEYQWETGQTKVEDSALSLWVELQRNAPVPNTDLESILAPDLMRLLLHVYLRTAPTDRVAEVQAAFDELRRFYDWVAVTQEIDRREVLDHCNNTLLEHLQRLQDAGVALSNDRAAQVQPSLLQIEDIGPDGFGASNDDGGHHWFLADQAAVGQLVIGDLVLAGFTPVGVEAATSMQCRLAGMVVVLPVDARSLIQ